MAILRSRAFWTGAAVVILVASSVLTLTSEGEPFSIGLVGLCIAGLIIGLAFEEAWAKVVRRLLRRWRRR